MQDQQLEQQKKFSIWLFILLFLIAFVRYFPIYFGGDRWWADSSLNGNFAYQFAVGHVILPFFAYQLPPYLHGSQVTNVLLIPFYYFSGPFYGWISFLGLLLSSAILAFSVLLSRWATDEKNDGATAFVLILLFFPPPVYTYFMKALWANHFETTFFFVASLALFCWAAKKEENLKLPLFVLGLFLGFSSFFCYTSISFAFALTLSMWYLKGRKFLRHSWLFIIGLLIGFLPALLYNLTCENVIMSKYLSLKDMAGAYSEAKKLRNVGFYSLYDLAFKVMPRYLNHNLDAQSIAFASLFGLSFVYLLWRVIFKRDKNPLKVGIFLTFLSYALFYAVSTYAVFDYKNVFYYRYVIFLFPAMVLAISFLVGKLRFFAPLIALLLLAIQGQSQLYRYPSSVDEFKYVFQEKKGYDLIRIYEQSMIGWLSKNPLKAPEIAAKILRETSGFERVVALKGLGDFRFNLLPMKTVDANGIEQQITAMIGQADRKWLAFGWGMAQGDCFSSSNCSFPPPIISSDEEEKWFATGFILRHFWGKKWNESSFKEGEEAIVKGLSKSSLAFAFGFSANEANYPFPPWPGRPENHFQIIKEYLDRLGTMEDPLVREQFWKGAGCETAFWFLIESFLIKEGLYDKMIAPDPSLNSFNPDAASLADGWQECLAEFDCKQSEYDSKIGKIVKVVCKGEEF